MPMAAPMAPWVSNCTACASGPRISTTGSAGARVARPTAQARAPGRIRPPLNSTAASGSGLAASYVHAVMVVAVPASTTTSGLRSCTQPTRPASTRSMPQLGYWPRSGTGSDPSPTIRMGRPLPTLAHHDSTMMVLARPPGITASSLMVRSKGLMNPSRAATVGSRRWNCQMPPSCARPSLIVELPQSASSLMDRTGPGSGVRGPGSIHAGRRRRAGGIGRRATRAHRTPDSGLRTPDSSLRPRRSEPPRAALGAFQSGHVLPGDSLHRGEDQLGDARAAQDVHRLVAEVGEDDLHLAAGVAVDGAGAVRSEGE